MIVIVVQSLNHVRPFANPRTIACQSSLSFTIPRSLLKFMYIVSMIPSTISSSVIPVSFCLQSCPVSGSFSMSQLFASGGQSIGASASTSVFPTNIQGWFPLGLTGLILQSRGLSKVLQHYNLKVSILQHSAFFMVQLSHLYMTTGKTIALTTQTLVGKEKSLLFNALSRFVIALLPRSKRLLISWL